MCDRVLIINFQQRRAERTDTRDVHGTAYKTNPTHPVEKVIKGSHTRPARRPRSALSRAGALVLTVSSGQTSDERDVSHPVDESTVSCGSVLRPRLVWLGTTSSLRGSGTRIIHANSNTGAEAQRKRARSIQSRVYLHGLTCIAGGTAKANEARGQVRALLHPHLARISPRAAAAATALLQPCYSPATALLRLRRRLAPRASARLGCDLWLGLGLRLGLGLGLGLGPGPGLGLGPGPGLGLGVGVAIYGLGSGPGPGPG